MILRSCFSYHFISQFLKLSKMLLIDCQPDPHLAAEEEAKRSEERQKQAAQERVEQCEKAHVRGFQPMKKIHLAQVRILAGAAAGRWTDRLQN